MTVGDELELTIDRPAFGGDVIAIAPDGRIVFLSGAAPGDVVLARITHRSRRFMRGAILRLVSAGARVEPPCPHFERCGGCPWMAVPRDVQRETLRAHVSRALDVDLPPIEPTVGLAWRATARVHWRDGRLGYHPRGSHEVLDVDVCPVLSPSVAALYAEVRGLPLPGVGTLRITAPDDGGPGTVQVEVGRLDLRAVGAGRSNLFDGVAHPAGSFVQAHRPGNATLVAAVVDALGDEESVLELYAGSGNFTFALASRGVRVTAIDTDAAAVKAMRKQAARRGLPIDARVGSAGNPPVEGQRTALLDPPRSGAEHVLRVLDDAGIERIAYVSCDPATLERDIRGLRPLGWTVDSARAFDLFPHTGHVEVLALLSRARRG